MFSLFICPGYIVFVGEDTTCNGCSIIAIEADHHKVQPWESHTRPELEFLITDSDLQLVIGSADCRGVLVVVLGDKRIAFES